MKALTLAAVNVALFLMTGQNVVDLQIVFL